MKLAIKILSVAIILVVFAQLALTTQPFYELEFTSMGEIVTEEFSLSDLMWLKTERMTLAFRNIDKTAPGYNRRTYTLNDFIAPLALAFAIALMVILTSICSQKSIVTHVFGVLYPITGFAAYYGNKILTRETLPGAADVVKWSQILIIVASVLIAIRTVLWIYERYIKAYINFKKAKVEWSAMLEEAKAAEAAEAAEVVAE